MEQLTSDITLVPEVNSIMDVYLDSVFAQYYQAYPLTLVDVGASGGVSELWQQAGRYLHLIGFEPDPREFGRLTKVRQSVFQRQYFNIGLYNKKTKIDFHLLQKQETSSILRPNLALLSAFPMPERFDVIDTIEVAVDTLDNQLTQNDIQDVDFIKLDTQGSELFILQGGLKTLRKPVIGLEIEIEFVPIYRGQPTFSDVDPFVREFGFQMFDMAPVYWKRAIGQKIGGRKGQLIYVEALYLRSFEALVASFPPNASWEYRKAKVLKALSVSILYGYVDYALELLMQASAMNILSESEKDLIVQHLFTPARGRLHSIRGCVGLSRLLQRVSDLFVPHGLWPWFVADGQLGNRMPFQ